MIASIITHHRDAFHDAQLEILLNTVTHIAKTTTMRRALRGALKILTAVAVNARIPDANLKSSVAALCAIFGTPTLKFGEEAWICLFNLTSSENNQHVGEILVNQILHRPDISETRSLAKYKGGLLAIQRIVEDSSLIPSIAPSLSLLLISLQRAYTLDANSNLVTMRIIEGILFSDILAKLLVDEKWDVLRQELNQRDQSLTREGGRHEIAGARTKITTGSPLYNFINSNFASNEAVASRESEEILGRLGERISYLLENQWQALSEDQSLLAMRLLLHISRYVPRIWVPAVQVMWSLKLLTPTNENWSPHLDMLGSLVASNPLKPEPVIQSLLQIFARLQPLLQDDTQSSKEYGGHLQSIFENLRDHKILDIDVIKPSTDLMMQITLDVDSNAFEEFLHLIEKTSAQAYADLSSSATVLESISECLVWLFSQCFSRSYSKTVRIFKLLIDVAASSRATRARLLAMRLLTRMRCNTDYAIKITNLPAPDELSSNLCRKHAPGITSEAAGTPMSRPSTHGYVESSRIGRSSAAELGSLRSRSGTRSLNAKEQWQRVISPVWVQDSSMEELPFALPTGSSPVTYAQNVEGKELNILDLGPWLELMINILKGGSDWELYSYVLVHLPLQLSNHSLFSNQIMLLQILHSLVVAQLNGSDFPEPPKDSGIKKGEVALCLYQVLKMLLPYHEHFGRRMAEDTVRTFRMGIEKWERTGKCCIHALALCCYEIPSYIEKQIVGITELMQKRITQADLAMDILEFLRCLSRLRQAYGEADIDFYRRIFGICIRYLQVAWEQRQKRADAGKPRFSAQYNRQSGSSGETRAAGPVQSKESQGLSEYVYLLAYQTIIVWFLSIDVRERAQHVGWLTQELSWPDELGKERMEEQSLVVLDMMHRTAFSNLGETMIGSDFVNPLNKVITRMWLVGMSIITTEIAVDQATEVIKAGQLTKRQASGTTHATYQHNTAELPSHHVQDDVNQSKGQAQDPLHVYPNHLFLQITSTIAPTPLPLQPIPLPDDDFMKRAIRVFDKIDTVDGHKVGVIYIGEGQQTEAEILANTHGSDGYEAFLTGLGTKVLLKGAKFNTQGLDHQADEDGTHTFAWRDRVTEVVFHIPTLMPTDLTDDPQCDKKKRHVGNDHIKIVFNASGLPFDFDTFATAMNTVNIVITPEAHTHGADAATDRTIVNRDSGVALPQDPTKTERFGFFCVQTLFSQAYPQFSTAAGTQIISADALPAFVRQIAVTCSVFCRVWEDSIIKDSEYISGWRARLQEIIKLRKRYANTNTSANVHYPMSGADSALQYSEGSEWTGTATMGGMADTNKLLNSLDFTRWT